MSNVILLIFFFFPFSTPIKVGTFSSLRVFPKTTLQWWGHCPHFLIQWQRLWESSMLLVLKQKGVKWLYWKSICSCEVPLIFVFLSSLPFVIFAPMKAARRFTTVGFYVWGFLFFCIFIHKHKVKGSFGVLFVYFLEEEMCRFFFSFFFF